MFPSSSLGAGQVKIRTCREEWDRIITRHPVGSHKFPVQDTTPLP